MRTIRGPDLDLDLDPDVPLEPLPPSTKIFPGPPDLLGEGVTVMVCRNDFQDPILSSNANTSGLGDVGLSETYRFAYESIRNGAPGLSDATCAAIARSINMKVSLAANDRATAAEARADRLALALKDARAILGDRSRDDWSIIVQAISLIRAALQQETQPMTQTPTDALRLVQDDHEVIKRCVERMPPLYMRGQTEGPYLHSDIAGLIDIIGRLAAAPASPLPGGGWRTDFENAPDCEEGILIVDATKISPAVGTARFVGGEWRGYDHGYGVECSWPSPTHWMPLPAAPTGEPK